MKHCNGIKVREDRSRGIEILIDDTFAKINPTDPLRLAKQTARKKRKFPIPPVLHWTEPLTDASRYMENSRRLKSSSRHKYGLKCRLSLA
jgi:hypothetical protein